MMYNIHNLPENTKLLVTPQDLKDFKENSDNDIFAYIVTDDLSLEELTDYYIECPFCGEKLHYDIEVLHLTKTGWVQFPTYYMDDKIEEFVDSICSMAICIPCDKEIRLGGYSPKDSFFNLYMEAQDKKNWNDLHYQKILEILAEDEEVQQN